MQDAEQPYNQGTPLCVSGFGSRPYYCANSAQDRNGLAACAPSLDCGLFSFHSYHLKLCASEPIVRGLPCGKEGEVLCWRLLTNLAHLHPAPLRSEVKLFYDCSSDSHARNESYPGF